MQILDDIPFTLDAAALMSQLHIAPASDDAGELQELIGLATKAGRPKAAFSEAFVDGRDGDRVRIGNVWFASRTLSRNLATAQRVFPLVATCGREMDQAFDPDGDMLKEFWWDLIKTQLLFAANKRLNEQLNRKFRLDKTATMRPGSGDVSIWPIEQQRGLFELLGDMEQAIGVTLTDTFLMVPNKTTSGIVFPTEVDFRSCQVCHREKCPSRQAPFSQELWEQMEHD